MNKAILAVAALLTAHSLAAQSHLAVRADSLYKVAIKPDGVAEIWGPESFIQLKAPERANGVKLYARKSKSAQNAPEEPILSISGNRQTIDVDDFQFFDFSFPEIAPGETVRVMLVNDRIGDDWDINADVLLYEFTYTAPVDYQSVTVFWNPAPEPDFHSYRVYYGREERVYTSVVNTAQDTLYYFKPTEGGPWHFAVTASDSSGNESEQSNEVFYNAKEIIDGDTTPPEPVVLRIKVNEGTTVKVTTEFSVE